jgi:hypothetical protein
MAPKSMSVSQLQDLKSNVVVAIDEKVRAHGF